jgi:hypothetical protein
MGNEGMCRKCHSDPEEKKGSKVNKRQIVSLAFGNLNKKGENGIEEKLK